MSPVPLLAELRGLLVPPRCAACRAPMAAADGLVCSMCLRALPWLDPGCPRCALPGHRGGRCPMRQAAFTRAWAPMAHAGSARALVLALKFDGALAVAELMAAQLAAGLPEELEEDAILVPVPTHPRSRRRRGFDQAERLARSLASRSGLPMERCLRRVGSERHQVGLGAAARRSAGQVTVRATGKAPEIVLLVDDVLTSGATAQACATELRAAGAREVRVVAYARAL